MKLLSSLKDSSKAFVIAAFAAIYLIWGSTYLGIMFAIQSIPPMLMGGFRFLIAGSLLLLWCYYKKEPLPSRNTIIKSSIAGILLLFWGNGAVIWAEQYIPSGLTAIIVAAVPLWFVLFDKRQWKTSFSNFSIISGLLLGFGGVVMLVSNSGASTQFSISNHNQLMGLLVLVSGSIAWTLGSLQSKYTVSEGSTLMKVCIQMLIAGVAFMIAAFIRGEYQTFHFQQVSTNSWLALIYLITFGSLIGFLSYVWLLTVRTPSQVGTYAYVNPSVAVLLGWLLASEVVTFTQFAALAIILFGVMLVNKGNSKNKKTSSQAVHPEVTAQTGAIARVWHGAVPTGKAESYHQFLQETGLKDYSEVEGNKGVFLLKKEEGETTHFLTLTLWDKVDSIKQFAGEAYEKARYYPEDADFLLEFEPTVQHYEILEQPEIN